MAPSQPTISTELRKHPEFPPFAFPDARGRAVELSEVASIVDSASDRTVLIGNRLCPFATRAWFALHELGAQDRVEYLHVHLGDYKPAWFTESLNSYGTVPVLWDEGRSVPESLVVTEYLAEKYGPERELFGRNPAEKAMVQLVLAKMDIGAIYSLLRCRDPVALDECKAKCDRAMEAMEDFYSDADPYLLGDHFSAADIAFAPFLARFVPGLRYWRGYELLRPEAHPKLCALWSALQERPAFKATTCDPDFFVDGYWAYAEGPRAGSLRQNAISRFTKSRPGTALAAAAIFGAVAASAVVLNRRR